jgi:hypothetical protein
MPTRFRNQFNTTVVEIVDPLSHPRKLLTFKSNST